MIPMNRTATLLAAFILSAIGIPCAGLGALLAGAPGPDPGRRPAPKPSPADVEREVRRLGSSDLAERVAAMARLEVMGPSIIPRVQRIRDGLAPGDALRARADRALQRLRALRLRQELVERASTGLVFAGQYRDLAAVPDVAAALLGVIGDPRYTPALREAAVNALCDVASRDVLPALRALLDDPLTEDRLREALAFAAARLGEMRWIDERIMLYRRELQRAQGDADRLAAHRALARIHYRRKAYEKALEHYGAMIALFRKRLGALAHPSPALRGALGIHYYNAACTAGLMGRLDEAVRYLRLAQETDPGSTKGLLENIEQDGDLKGLREDPRGRALLEELRGLLGRGRSGRGR